MKTTTSPKKPARARRVGLILALLAFSGALALVLAEIALRLFPIPGISYHSFCYDPVTGGTAYPGSTVMFRGDDGVLVTHHINSWGFPDVEHRTDATPGTLRIGFFGDSYTEALQVPLENAFFRLIEGDLSTRMSELAGLRDRDGHSIVGVETLGFGVSGRSALQSYLECGKWMNKLDLDYVVYVFVENDPADQIRRLSGSDLGPYPIMAADSFTIDASFNERYGYKTSRWHRAMQRIKSNSLVVSTIEGRLKLLKAYGVKRKVTDADRAGAAIGVSLMPVSKWPPELVEDGWTLQERVMDRWRRDVEGQGRKFVILRVPREETLTDPAAAADSWTPRLRAYCQARGIDLVDPAPVFLARMKAGETMYGHHFTPQGHRAFAEAFVNYMLASSASP